MTGAWAMVAVGVMLAQGAVPFTPLTRGAMSGIDTPRYVVVRTDEDWRRVWAAHTTRDERPVVDFSATMVLGVFLGSRPNPLYGVEIVSVTDGVDGVVVGYAEQRPAPDAMAPQVMASPFHVVTVEARSAPIHFAAVARP